CRGRTQLAPSTRQALQEHGPRTSAQPYGGGSLSAQQAPSPAGNGVEGTTQYARAHHGDARPTPHGSAGALRSHPAAANQVWLARRRPDTVDTSADGLDLSVSRVAVRGCLAGPRM